jgi:phosphatidylinositol alpha-1,6-mannosyltransferase
MRILLVTFEFPPFSGGIATYTHTAARGLAELGCRVRVLAPSYPEEGEADETADFETVRMGVRHGAAEFWRFAPATVEISRALSEFEPHVVLLTSDLAHGVGAVACSLEGVPYVPVVHGSEITKHFPATSILRRIQAFWLGHSYRGAARVFCVSHFVRDLMARAGFSPSCLTVIHNGIDPRILHAEPSPERMRQIEDDLHLDGKKVILTIARLVERKGQAEMIRALPSIVRRHPEACYVVAGTGEDAGRLKALARTLGVDDAVRFPGEISEGDKIGFLDLCDIYVLPSHSDGVRVEGLGIGLLEAGARGKPLVGGRHGGVPEIVSHGENGFLVDVTREGELCRAVSELLDHPHRAREMGDAARRTIAEGFLSDRMARETKLELERILSSTSAGAA